MSDSPLPRLDLQEDERIDRVNEQLCLIQKKHGLTYGTDAFLLAAYVKASSRARAVELGGGTGIVSLLIAAKKKAGHITAIEVQPEFAELIDRNAKINGLDSSVKSLCMDVRDATRTARRRGRSCFYQSPLYAYRFRTTKRRGSKIYCAP